MDTIRKALSHLTIGEPLVHENLTMFPLFGTGAGSRDYLTLDEALASGRARVTEVSPEGRVPDLLFVNEGDRPVLLLDGEELKGAKQNRILNLTILAPADKTITIPVACVEAGRWRWSSPRFESSPYALHSEARLFKHRRVSDSLGRSGQARTDQAALWREIAEKSFRLGTSSRSSALDGVYESHAQRIEAFVKELCARPGMCGAVFALGDEVRGCELFDHPEAAERLMPKIVRSYALDAIERTIPGARQDGEAAAAFLRQIAESRVQSFPSIGLGEDARIDGEALVGGALIVEGRLVHLSAYRVDRASPSAEEDADSQGLPPIGWRMFHLRRRSSRDNAA
jgi:hypothetical protein